MFVLEGEDGNWDGAVEVMAEENSNPKIKFFMIAGHDHFNVIAPIAEMLAKQIVSGRVNVTQQSVDKLR